jgi:hypothetical protein
VFIVNNFVPDINRSAKFFQRFLNDADGPINPCTETTRLGKDNSFLILFNCGMCHATVLLEDGATVNLKQSDKGV